MENVARLHARVLLRASEKALEDLGEWRQELSKGEEYDKQQQLSGEREEP